MSSPDSIRSLKLDAINTSAGTQIRTEIDQQVVDDYAAAMLDVANKFPPVVVFKTGDEMILADGFHRVMAARQNGFKDILADVRPGGRADALRHALSANAAHGLRRTNQDKRHSVQLALQEWPKLSDRELAKICAVSDHFVGDVQRINCERIAVATGTHRRGWKKAKVAGQEKNEGGASNYSTTGTGTGGTCHVLKLHPGTDHHRCYHHAGCRGATGTELQTQISFMLTESKVRGKLVVFKSETR